MITRHRTRQEAAQRHVLAPENLPYQLFLLVQQLTRQFQEILTPFGVTPLHWGILCCLWDEDGLKPGDIALRLTQLGGTITVGLKALEARRLVRRKADAKDGRSTRVFLTRRGSDLRGLIVPEAQDLIDRTFADLDPLAYARFASTVSALRRKTLG